MAFDAELLYSTLLAGGIDIVTTQHVIPDNITSKNLPAAQAADSTIVEYVATGNTALADLQEYAKHVAKGQMATSRFPVTCDAGICSKMS